MGSLCLVSSRIRASPFCNLSFFVPDPSKARFHSRRIVSRHFRTHQPTTKRTHTHSKAIYATFRPCIDIHKGKVKQIVGSTLIDSPDGDAALVTNFESEKSPAEFAEIYKRDGLVGGHVVMLGDDVVTRSAAIEALNAYPGGLQIGGGINLDNAIRYLEEGASHVIVTSFVFKDGQIELNRLRNLVDLVGKHRLVLDLSCRKKDGQYTIVTDRWQKFTDAVVDEETLTCLAHYADEFLVHGVDVEGKKLGVDEDLVAVLGRGSPIPVTYAGGATTLADLEKVKVAGGGRVCITVGSALDTFGGNLAYKEVVAWHYKQAGPIFKMTIEDRRERERGNGG